MISTYQQKHVLFHVTAHRTYLPCAFSPNIWSKKFINFNVGTSSNINTISNSESHVPPCGAQTHLTITKLHAKKITFPRSLLWWMYMCLSYAADVPLHAPYHLSHWPSFLMAHMQSPPFLMFRLEPNGAKSFTIIRLCPQLMKKTTFNSLPQLM